MIKFQTATPSTTVETDIFKFGKEHGLSAKESARIFLKLGPLATSSEVLEEAKSYALKLKAK